jgi:hypothetical protein
MRKTSWKASPGQLPCLVIRQVSDATVYSPFDEAEAKHMKYYRDDD